MNDDDDGNGGAALDSVKRRTAHGREEQEGKERRWKEATREKTRTPLKSVRGKFANTAMG